MRNKKLKLFFSTGTDRISLLPDCLLHHIFSFLNCKFIVQCHILSKRWRYLWTSMPFLNFATPDYDSSLSSPTTLNQTFDGIDKFTRFVLHVLSNRSYLYEIKKLIFITDGIETTFWNQLLSFAASHRVQELSLSLFHSENPFFDKLGSLRLESLKSLKIDCYLRRTELNIDDDVFLSCPNLEFLALRACFELIVKITSVKLSCLELSSMHIHLKDREMELRTPKLITLRLENYLPVLKCYDGLPTLKEVELNIRRCGNPKDEARRRIAKQLMASLVVLRNVTSLTLSTLCAEVLSFIPSSYIAPHDVLSNLRHLKLKTNKRMITMPSHLLNYLLKGPSFKTFVIEHSQFQTTIFTRDYPWRPTTQSWSC